MLQLDYFLMEGTMVVKWVMLTLCKMLEFTNSLSLECTGIPQCVHLLCRTKTTCFGESNTCSVAVSVAAEQTHSRNVTGIPAATTQETC
jgi:hypothetical protein